MPAGLSGCRESRYSRIRRMYSGVVPQQPPTRTAPLFTQSSKMEAKQALPTGYFPLDGIPAFGLQITGRAVRARTFAMKSGSSSEAATQLTPMAAAPAFSTASNASATVSPDQR